MKNLTIPRNIVAYGMGECFRFFLDHCKDCKIDYVIDKNLKADTDYRVVKIEDANLDDFFVVITMFDPVYRCEAERTLNNLDKKHYVDYMFYEEYLKWENSEDFLKYCENKTPVFTQVEIETINRCNMRCSFCPCNIETDKRPYAKMSMDLFDKITTELQQIDYVGNITLFSNNEPFLDERTPQFAKKLKEKCPKACLIIFTNTTLLSMDKFKAVIPYVDKLVLDNYWVGYPHWNRNVIDIYQYIKNKPSIREKVVFEMRPQDEILTARAGTAPNKKDMEYPIPKIRCSRVFYDYIIRPDGGVSLCCNDAQAKYTIGNVNENGLLGVWYSDSFENIRRTMIKSGREKLDLCNVCDALYEGAPYGAEISVGKMRQVFVNDFFMYTEKKKNTIELLGVVENEK